jgi:hypothetical protein
MKLRTKIISVLAGMIVALAIAVPALASSSAPRGLPPLPGAFNASSLVVITNARLRTCGQYGDNLCEQEVNGEYSNGLSLAEAYYNAYYTAQLHYRADCAKLRAHRLSC